MKKTILFLLNKEVTYLPPFMAILDSLCSQYSLKVISYEKVGGVEALRKQYAGRDVTFLSKSTQDISQQLLSRVKRRAKRMLHVSSAFHKEVRAILEKENHDLLWIIHEHTLLEFQDYLKNRDYIVSFYELNDHDMPFIKKTQTGVRNARKVISCEYNRSCIMRVWYHLNYTPPVVPNKPYNHPREKDMPCELSEQLKGKKIIIFQGYIQRVRNIDKLCEAVSCFPDYNLVLMGGGDDDYIRELKDRYPNTLFTGFIQPPHHLEITSYARIGVVKYDHIFLDHTFCAPNKIWEYSGFGIPTLGNDLPGLEYTVGQAGAGVCVDFDDVEAIKDGIKQIERHYDEFSNNAIKFFDSVDLGQLLNSIVSTQI